MKGLKVLSTVLITSVLLTGCGSSGSSSNYSASDSYANGSGFTIDSMDSMSMSKDSVSYESYDESAGGSESGELDEVEKIVDTSKSNIKQMLVYSGELDLRTKDYEKSYDAVQKLLNETDSFIEWSEYSVNQDDWDNNSGLRTWNARVRIPSQNYDKVTTGIMDTSEVSRFVSNVDNLTAEYSDLVTSIDLYKASRERYLTLLSETRDNSYALELERELRNIEEQLARYEARKKTIETDVAYSYLDIELMEIHEYEAQTGYRDSFFTRLKNQVVNTFLTFLQFLELVLFFLIGAFPYLVIIGVIIFFTVKAVKKHKKPFTGTNFMGMPNGYMQNGNMPNMGMPSRDMRNYGNNDITEQSNVISDKNDDSVVSDDKK